MRALGSEVKVSRLHPGTGGMRERIRSVYSYPTLQAVDEALGGNRPSGYKWLVHEIVRYPRRMLPR